MKHEKQMKKMHREDNLIHSRNILLTLLVHIANIPAYIYHLCLTLSLIDPQWDKVEV